MREPPSAQRPSVRRATASGPTARTMPAASRLQTLTPGGREDVVARLLCGAAGEVVASAALGRPTLASKPGGGRVETPRHYIVGDASAERGARRGRKV